MVVCGAALIIKDKKILLTKRSGYTPAFPNHWTCPRGRGTPGEKPEEIVAREVKEEVGLQFKPTKLFSRGVWKDRELNRFVGVWSGRIHIQAEEIVDYGWFTYEEAAKLELAFDYKAVLQKLHVEGLM